MSALKDLMMRAVNGVEEEINKLTDFTGKDGFIGALNSTKKKLINDAKVQLKKIVDLSLIGVLSKETNTKLIPSIMGLVTPIQKSLDSIPIVGDLLPIDELVKDTLDEIFSSSFESVSKGCLTDANALLDEFLLKKQNEIIK